MDFSFSEEEESFRQEVREFLVKELPPGWMRGIYSSTMDAFAIDEVWAMRKQLAPKVGEKGWLAMTWPKEYGGSEASHVKSMIFEDEVYYLGAPVRDAFGISMIAPILIHFGTEEQKLEHLPPIARGELFWCEGFSEPEAGSDLAGIQTRAVEDGNDFIINGQKVWTSGAHRADWCFFLARTDPNAERHRGLSMFLVDMKTPGITLRPVININGHYEFNEVYFDDVRLPRENLVGNKNEGWRVAMALLDFERAMIGRIGHARRLFEEIIDYLKENKPEVLKNPLIRHRLSQQEIELNIARGLSYQVAWMEDQGLECSKEASISKICGDQAVLHVSDLAMELLGPYSQLKEGSWRVPLKGRIPALYLDSFGWPILAGTDEIQRTLIAIRGLGLPRG